MSEVENVLDQYIDLMKAGKLTNVAPLLPAMFTLRGKPFSLKDHMIWEPLFNMQVPKKRTIVCGRQVAKTVLSTSSVITYNGEPKVATDIKVGDNLLCLNEQASGWVSTSGRVTNVFDHYTKPMRRIVTRMGSELTVSKDHRLRTAEGYVRSEELNVGDRICTIRKGGVFENIPVDRKRLIITPYIIGDGCCTKMVRFTNSCIDVNNEIMALFPETKIKLKPKTDLPCWELFFGKQHYGNTLHTWLKEDGLIGCRSNTKFIPSWVFRLSKADTITFISRLYATDGSIKPHVGNPSITYCSNSRKLIDGLQALLIKLGLPTTIRQKEFAKETHLTAYVIRIETREAQDWFLENIKVPGKPVPVELLKKKSSNNRATWPKPYVIALIEKHTQTTFNKKGESLRKYGLRKTLKYPPTAQKIQQFVEYFKAIGNLEAVEEFSQLLNTDVYWDTIKSIEEIGEQEAIDFEVEPHHNFVLAGGVVTHNSETSAVQMLTWQLLKDYTNILYVAPRDNQTTIFSNDKVAPYIENSPIFANRDTKLPNGTYKRSISQGSNMYFSYAFLDAERIRSITAGAIFYDESLVRDTKIPTYNVAGVKTVKNISDVKAGDIVDSFTDKGYKLSSVVVGDAAFHGNQPCYRVTTESGRTVVGTSTHPLWTNKGPLRIGDMIRDVYRTADASNKQLHNGSSPDVIGDTTWGWEHDTSKAQEDRQLPIASRRTTTQLQSSQIHDIIRIRNKSSFIEEERELQSLLLANTPTRGLSLCLLVDVQQSDRQGTPEEVRNTRVARSYRSSRTGLVGRRRWVSRKTAISQPMYSKLLTRGARDHKGVVVRPIRCKRRYTYRLQRQPVFSSRCTKHSETHQNYNSIHYRLYEVQGRSKGASVSSMRRGALSRSCYPPRMLKVTPESSTGRLVQKTSRSDVRVRQEVQRGKQGGNQPTKAGYPKRISREIQGIHPKVPRQVPGKVGRDSTTLRGKTESRPSTLRSPEKETPRGGTRETYIVKEGRRALRAISCQTKSNESVEENKSIRESRRDINGSGDQETSSRSLSGVTKCQETTDQICKIEFVGYQDVWDIEVAGTHNYVLENNFKSLNCQDINPAFLVPIQQVMAASLDFGVTQSTGTPKTFDNNLETQWAESSQAEWCIPCHKCKKLNVPAVEFDLLGMIQPHGLACAKCGTLLNTREGWWEHRYPQRRLRHEGYHGPQVIFPMHCEKQPEESGPVGQKWQEILYQQESMPTYGFYNEILGTSYDNASELISKTSLVENSTLDHDNSYESAVKLAHDRRKYTYVTMGVDWGGGGESGVSRTAIAILGWKSNAKPDVIYMDRILNPLPTDQEALLIKQIAQQFKVDLVADDYCGAGEAKEVILLQTGFPYEKLMPIAYIPSRVSKMMEYVPAEDKVSRPYVKVARTKSLTIMAALVNNGYYTFPKFEAWDVKEYPNNLLSLVQEKRDSTRGPASYFITHKANRADDLAHAINYASIGYWFVTKNTPDFSKLLGSEFVENGL